MNSLPKNVVQLKESIRRCRLCPRSCGVDRTRHQTGDCRIGDRAVVASSGAHYGEEPVLVGKGGSGTIFFSGCSLHCVFCQNHELSHSAQGTETTGLQLAELMRTLERRGCVNINLVTPTHVAHVVAEGIVRARAAGLGIPVVYNCGGYETVETLQLLEGLIDIYMPDFKWADDAAGGKYSGANDYPALAAAALREMHRQVGPLKLDARGLAQRGMLVRHLVMPQDLARSSTVVEIVAQEAPGSTINIMAQYRPAFRAAKFPELQSRTDPATIRALRAQAAARGLMNVDH